MNPEDFSFWEREEKDFWGVVDELVLAALAAGIIGGQRLLPDDYLEEIDPQALEDAIVEFMGQYNMGVFAEISITSMMLTLALISKWKQSGEPIEYLEEDLRSKVFSDSRADMISISEVTRLFAAGNEIVWGATGLIFAKVWQTSLDERVCPVCAPMHGMISFLGIGFPNGIKNPPAHPRCRCWLRPALWEALVLSQIVGEING
jgi:SPP1 gp7 family putative phage head morphogenesis protein